MIEQQIGQQHQVQLAMKVSCPFKQRSFLNKIKEPI